MKWQATLDNERTVHVGGNLAERVVSQISHGVYPIRLDLPDRKNNNRPWYTFIGKVTQDALGGYFEERGWSLAQLTDLAQENLERQWRTAHRE